MRFFYLFIITIMILISGCVDQPINPIPTPIPTPEPITTPVLRPYNIDKSQDIWHAYDPSSYITPKNPWVLKYALSGDTPQTQYIPDSDLYPNDPNMDYWQNADYTLYTLKGDCEDLSIVEVSIFKAKGINAIVVGGYLEDDRGNRIRDFWVEYVSPSSGESVTRLTSDSAKMNNYKLIPTYMFNDQIKWTYYNPHWYY